jgi:hypothetical protein
MAACAIVQIRPIAKNTVIIIIKRDNDELYPHGHTGLFCAHLARASVDPL